jgi:protein-disulfide isomerase
LGFLAITVAATRRSKLFFPLAAAAAAASLLLLVESLVAIRSLCLLCEGVHLVSFALAWLAWRERGAAREITRDDAIAIAAIPAAMLVAARLFVPPYWAMIVWKSGVPYPSGIDDDGNHWIGAVDPAVTVHEFVDYACPHCAIAAGRMRMKVADNPSKLRVVRRHQPRVKCLGESPLVCVALRAAMCAGEQDKFWEMDSWLFARNSGKLKVDLAQAAEELDLDLAQMEACMTAPATWERARAEAEAARKAGIKATPGYVVDGEKLDSKELAALLDERL